MLNTFERKLSTWDPCYAHVTVVQNNSLDVVLLASQQASGILGTIGKPHKGTIGKTCFGFLDLEVYQKNDFDEFFCFLQIKHAAFKHDFAKWKQMDSKCIIFDGKKFRTK